MGCGVSGVGRSGDECSVNGGRWGKGSVQSVTNLFLTEGAVMTESGSLFCYFTILTKNVDPLLWRWLAPWRGVLLDHVEREGGKTGLDQYPKGP